MDDKNAYSQEASMEGNLERKGAMGFWIKKYCRLVGKKLLIYKKISDKSPELEISINFTTNTEITNPNNNRFKITYGNNEIIHFQAKTKNLMMRWVLDLRGCSFTNPSISMDMFDIISVIGRGFYGKVMLCRKKDTHELLAIKTVHKNRLIRENKLHTILTERSVLTKIDSPFIITLKYAFQTMTKFYLCLEYAAGGDLFHLLKKRGTIFLSERDIKLYIIEISLAIDYLHQNEIIYRDLKPENILFDASGHIKLTDFGLSKDLNESETTRTFCGTSEYMAPEIIKRSGYDKSVDWWGVGLVAYELIFGDHPFTSINKQRMYSNIVNQDPFFEDGTDPELKSLLLSLLNKNPKKRGNFETIKNSKFFSEFDFNDVMKKKISPNYVPEFTNSASAENFDREFTEEKAFDSLVKSSSGTNNFIVSNFSYSCIEKLEILDSTMSSMVPMNNECDKACDSACDDACGNASDNECDN